MFHECQDRIRSMSLLHEKLYRAGNVNNIDFSEYLKDLTEHLARSYGAAERHIAMTFKIEPAVLHLDQLIPCGMIVNELVSNALKHAFPAGEAGEIEVAFSCEDRRCRLSVSDNGADLPESASDMPESLGMQVVAALVDQLRGELSIASNPRKEFVIAFAENPPTTPGTPEETSPVRK
jgi:two-component sensor histidine kinase